MRINKQVRHSVNHKFFSEDNENSFYWAGFLAADGNVRKRRGSCREISLALSIKDKNHIEKFINAIESTAHMGIYLVKNSKRNSKWNDTKKAEVKITSEQMFNDLARFNVVLRKSLIYTFPEWLIEHKLVNHYMRGYFDGDGSFYFSQSPNKQEYFKSQQQMNSTVFRRWIQQYFSTTTHTSVYLVIKSRASDARPRESRDGFSGNYTKKLPSLDGRAFTLMLSYIKNMPSSNNRLLLVQLMVL